MKKMTAFTMASLLLAAGCAKRPENITARFAPASGYRAMACEQLNDERMRVGLELQRITALQQENADADALLMGVGMVIFWPALIGLAATTDRSDQIAGMMGERDAMDIAAREKGCAPVNLPGPPTPTSPPPAQTT